MSDETETIRRVLTVAVNIEPGSREDLESKYGDVWDTQQLQENFTVLGFCSPFVVATRKIDGTRGSLVFQHSPRFYHSFKPK